MTVDTPALLLDLDKVERNLDRMASLFAGTRVGLRPHAKTHKTATIAKMQLARGAVGICCAKLGEAEALGARGVQPLLITTEIVGPLKLARLIALARACDVTVVVDAAESADALSHAAAEGGVLLSVLVDVDVGQRRTGIAPGEPAVQLGRHVAALPGLTLMGLQGYEGHLQHIVDPQQRREANASSMRLLCETAEAFRDARLPTEIVTTGGTGTSVFAADYETVTDVQPGSYVVMDAQYGAVAGVAFENALTVATTVISVRGSTAIVDAGLKCLSSDVGMPTPRDLDADFTLVGDEHGKLTFPGARQVEIGDIVQIVPSHCDTTINLFDRYVVHRGGEIVDEWPIVARGRST